VEIQSAAAARIGGIARSKSWASAFSQAAKINNRGFIGNSASFEKST
jgi:hypothetical protein